MTEPEYTPAWNNWRLRFMHLAERSYEVRTGPAIDTGDRELLYLIDELTETVHLALMELDRRTRDDRPE